MKKVYPIAEISKAIRFALPFMMLAFLLWAVPTLSSASSFYKGPPAKYVFLFIGDGMGTAQRMAAEKYVGAQLVINSLPVQGITTTFAADRFITGSAAAGTALACGQKTNIGMLGMTTDGQPIKSLAVMAKERGQKVGIISSVSLDHATPAAFYAHVADRDQIHDIEKSLSQSRFDFLGGGGLLNPFTQQPNIISLKGSSSDAFEKAGYKIVGKKKDFLNLSAGSGKIFAHNSWLPDSEAMPYAVDAGENDIDLAHFTAKAIELLDNPKGFFLMVEGGKIDWACHANDAVTAIQDILDLDTAVQEAVDFAQKHADETLVVATADHETGGLALGWAGTKYESNFEILENQKISFQKFSDEIIPQFQKECEDNCSFEAFQPIITKYFGFKFSGDDTDDPMVLTDGEIDQLKAAYDKSFSGKIRLSKNQGDALLYGDYPPVVTALTRCLNNKAGLGWTTFKHTGVPVTTSAMGVGAESFNGFYDNTEVAKKIMAVMGAEPKAHPYTEEDRKAASAR